MFLKIFSGFRVIDPDILKIQDFCKIRLRKWSFLRNWANKWSFHPFFTGISKNWSLGKIEKTFWHKRIFFESEILFFFHLSRFWFWKSQADIAETLSKVLAGSDFPNCKIGFSGRNIEFWAKRKVYYLKINLDSNSYFFFRIQKNLLRSIEPELKKKLYLWWVPNRAFPASADFFWAQVQYFRAIFFEFWKRNLI